MKLNRRRLLFGAALLAFGVGHPPALSGTAAGDAHRQNQVDVRTTHQVVGGVVTLYFHDPLAKSLCFSDGEYGSVLQKDEVRNRCSHLRLEQGSDGDGGVQDYIAVGVQGGEVGALMDLGTESELMEKYGYRTWLGSVFASIQMKDGKALILKGVRYDQRGQRESLLGEMEEAAALYALTPDQQGNQGRKPVKLGHIYVARIIDRFADRDPKSKEIWAKLLVTAHTPGQTVTLRWQSL